MKFFRKKKVSEVVEKKVWNVWDYSFPESFFVDLNKNFQNQTMLDDGNHMLSVQDFNQDHFFHIYRIKTMGVWWARNDKI